MKVRYRQRALADIENIYDYLKERSPRAATEVVARIGSAAEQLGQWPRMGHLGRAAATCEWVVVGSPYIIVYEIDEQPVRSRSSLYSTARKIATRTCK